MLNDTLAAQWHGRFLVRLEDIDPIRCTPALAQACLDDLAWLGLSWEKPERRQSAHLAEYQSAWKNLRDRRLLYPCFCLRSDIAAKAKRSDPDGAPLYPGTCAIVPDGIREARIASGAAHCWRLRTASAAAKFGQMSYRRFDLPSRVEREVPVDPAEWGDAVLVRKETPTSYHLSVVLDDAWQNVTHIVRGKDLEAATSLHVLLQKLLGLPTPLYHFHALLRDDSGGKLSKSRQSETLADLRAAGWTAAAVRAKLEGLPGFQSCRSPSSALKT